LTLVAFTFLGELLQSGTFLDAPTLIIFLVIYAIATSTFTLMSLNFVMARYDQLDAMPIYQSYNLVLGIVCGLLILGERDRYSTGDTVGIFLACMVVIGGIFVLGFKKTAIESQ